MTRSDRNAAIITNTITRGWFLFFQKHQPELSSAACAERAEELVSELLPGDYPDHFYESANCYGLAPCGWSLEQAAQAV